MNRDERERAILPFIDKLIRDFRLLQEHPCIPGRTKEFMRQRMPWLIQPEKQDVR